MNCISNPYVEEGDPRLRLSVVAFVDILGYKQLVQKAYKNRKGDSLLRKLHRALKDSHEHIDPTYANVFHNDRKPDSSAFRAFTDNVVIGRPALFFGEEELRQAFRELSRFQMRLAMDGFFVRGGISVGDLYMDDIMVYGPALLEAIEAESSLAIDPRIVLAKSAKEAVDKQLEYYPLRDEETPYVHDICKDADGRYYVDYLQAVLTAAGYFSKKRDLRNHKANIERQLKKNKGDPRIWSKYMWVAQYHNEFCDWCGDCPYLKIDISNFRGPNRRSIID
jgi:hypothetical protein